MIQSGTKQNEKAITESCFLQFEDPFSTSRTMTLTDPTKLRHECFPSQRTIYLSSLTTND